MMKVAIVDYGSGNLRSAQKSFERAARVSNISASIDLVTAPEQVAEADRLVLPGVGAYGDCHDGIRAIDGMWQASNSTAPSAHGLFSAFALACS
jgi:glutamine amidotransferase